MILSRMMPLLALGLVLIPLPGHAQTAAEPLRSITVSGDGEVEAVPDQAILPVEVYSKNGNLTEAKEHNDALTNKALAVIKKYDIPRQKVKTLALRINPQYRYDKGERTFLYYEVSRNLEITLDEMGNIEKLIAALTEAGVDRVQGVQFTLADPDAPEREARAEAMKDAIAKAKQLAEAAGAKLGPALEISLGGGGHMPPPMPMERMAMASMKSAEAAPPVLAGTTKVSQSVTVRFALQ